METLQRTANRGSISTGYDIDNSLKFEADNTEIIYRTNDSGTNRKTFTVSAWFKRTELGVDQQVWHGGTYGEATRIGISSYQVADDSLWIDVGGGTGNAGTLYRSFSTLKIRDTSAWYHVCVAVDTTQATEANRMKVWLNGEEVTDWAQHQIPAQDFQCALESVTAMAWGGYRPSNLVLFSGYLAECHYLDGVAKVQTDFGEYDEDSGIWKPKAYAGSYGGNGCYLNFDDSASLGADSSGNSNNFTLNNITSADQATDTPTNNFAVMNVLNGTNSDITTSQGGTKVSNSGSSICSMNATMGVSNGKWYWECRFANDPGNTNTVFVGIAAANDPYVPHNSNNYLGQQSGYGSIGWYFVNGAVYNGTGTWTGPGYGNIIMFALDINNLKLYFGKEGTWQNSSNPVTNTNGIDIATSFASLSGGTDIILPAISVAGGDNMDSMNFGGFANYTQSSPASDENGYGTFEYAPPSGYYALCTKNLAEYG